MRNRKLVVNILAFLALSAILTAAQMQTPNSETKPDKSSATPKTLTGIVSDSMCGAHHMAKDKSPAGCARMCVKQGMKYALVVGSKNSERLAIPPCDCQGNCYLSPIDWAVS